VELGKSSKDVIRESWYLSLGLNPGRHEYQIVLTTEQQPQGVKYEYPIYFHCITISSSLIMLYLPSKEKNAFYGEHLRSSVCAYVTLYLRLHLLLNFHAILCRS
jgi:hypothetical protein